MSRRFALLIAAAVIAMGCISSVVLADTDGAPGPAGPALAQDNEQAMAAERERQREFEIRRASADARAERARSREAHVGLGRDAAILLARQRFGGFLDSPLHPEPALAEGDRLIEYVSDDRAVVERANGQRVIARSLGLPFLASAGSGAKAPVDLSLQERGGAFAPANPLVPISIGSDGAVRHEESRIGFRVLGQSDYRLARLDSGRLFAESVQTDTDLVAMPSATGASVALQVRSAAAPEEATLEFDLPADARIRRATGPAARTGIEGPEALEIVRDGEVLAEVLPPAAWDAEGAPVEVSYLVNGDQVRLVFPHREKDLLYPLLVDPTVVWPTQVLGNWGTNGAPMSAGASPGGTTGSYWWLGVQYGSYLSIWNYPGTFNTGHYGQWTWTPGSSWTIAMAYFQGIHFTPSTANMCLKYGLWNPGGYTGYQTYCNAQSNATTYNVYGSGAGNYAVFSMIPNGNGARYTQANGITQWVVTYLKDQTTPTVTVNSSPSGWVKPANAIVTATGTDTPIGMDKLVLTNQTTGATLSTVEANPCNSSCGSILGGDLSAASAGNGSHTVRVYSYDAHGNTNYWSNIAVNVDGAPPTVPTYSGELQRLNGSTVAPGVYQLELDASDSGGSGFNRIAIETLLPGGSWTSAGNATLVNGRYLWTMPSGYATTANRLVRIRARAYDNAGNASAYASEISVTLRPLRSDPLAASGVSPTTHVYSYGAGDHRHPNQSFNAELRANNIDFVRMGLNMADAETSDPDDWNFAIFDNDVRLAAAQGMQIFPILIIQRPHNYSVCGPGEHADPPRGASELARFGRFAAAAARRYGPLDPSDASRGKFWQENQALPPNERVSYRPVMAWEVWNEPNSSSPLFAGGSADPDCNWPTLSYFTPQEYKDVLATVEAYVRDGVNGQVPAQPSARIVFGGLDAGDNVPFGQEYDAYLSDAINAGAGGRFDAVAIHPYGFESSVWGTMGTLRQTLDSRSMSDIQIWPNEFGIAVGSGQVPDLYENDRYLIPCFSGNPPQCELNQEQQLNAILNDFETQPWNVGPVAWHSIRDHPLDANVSPRWPQRTGLKTAYNSVAAGAAEEVNRPAFHTYRTHGYDRAARMLPPQH